jgi:hypothetical protein
MAILLSRKSPNKIVSLDLVDAESFNPSGCRRKDHSGDGRIYCMMLTQSLLGCASSFVRL